MENKLRYLKLHFIALLFLFVIHGFMGELHSQVVLNDNRTKEILFSEQSDRKGQSGSVISLRNYSSILSPELTIEENGWISNDDIQNLAGYTYSRNRDGFVSPGGISIEEIDKRVENAFSLKNGSSKNFGRLNISTDFIVTNTEISEEINLVLMVKNSSGEWIDAGRGFFLPDPERGEQSFSIQITVSDVFMKKGETVDLIWVNRSAGEQTHQLFTQRIEITPEYSDIFPFRRGDLLITEMMPRGDLDDYEFEYLEIYNPDDIRKSLKGITIETDVGTHTIKSDIEIPAYGYYVFSNADLSDIENVENSYFYPDVRLFSDSETSGRVQLKQNGEVIASAVYESAEVNIAFEAERMSQSDDGYTGLQNLKLSTNVFMKEVNGSPGDNGSSLPLYQKSFSDPGIYLIALPGRFYSNILRIENSEFYSLKGDRLQPSEIEPFEPVFLIKNDKERITLSVEGEKAVQNSLSRAYDTDSHQYISPVKPGFYSVRELFNDRDISAHPVVGVWNNSRDRVEIVNPDQSITELWKPVVVIRKDDHESVRGSTASEIPHIAESSFTFSLFEMQKDDEILLDEIWVEIDNESNLNATDQKPSYFSEPLFQFPEHNTDQDLNTTIMYGSYPGSERSDLSYFRLHPERDTYSEFSLGMFSVDASEQRNAVLRWDIPENIPEEWTITLTDRITGQQTDMRLEDHFQFRIRAESEKINDNNTTKKAVQQIEIKADEKKRFSIKFEPPNLTAESEEDIETPGSIELRQNYPNPFNPSTNITFFLPEERQVRLGIYNIVGQQVATLIDDNITAGEHSVVWNASNNPSGIYIVQLETGSRILTRKITLVK